MDNTGFEIIPPQDSAIAAWLILLITPPAILFLYDQHDLYSMLQWLLNGPFLFTFLLIIAFRQSFDWFGRSLFLAAAIILFSLSFLPFKSWTYYGGGLLLTAAGFYMNSRRPDSPERPGRKTSFISWGLIVSGALIIALAQFLFVSASVGFDNTGELARRTPKVDLASLLTIWVPYLLLASFELFACRIKASRLVTIVLAFICLLIALLALYEGFTVKRHEDYGAFIFAFGIFNLSGVGILWTALLVEIAVRLVGWPKPLTLWPYIIITLILFFYARGWAWFASFPPSIFTNWGTWFNLNLIISFAAILGYSLCWLIRSKIWGEAEVEEE